MNIKNLDREIPVVNLPTLANPDFSSLAPQEGTTSTDASKATRNTGAQTPPLTVSTTGKSTAAESMPLVVDLECPADGSWSISSSQLQKILSVLRQKSNDQHYKQGLQSIDAARQMTVAMSVASTQMMQSVDALVSRSAGTNVAGEVLNALTKIYVTGDENLDTSSCSPEAQAIIEIYRAQVAAREVTPSELTEEVLKQSWDATGATYTAADLAAGAALLDACYTKLRSDMQTETADELTALQEALKNYETKAKASADAQAVVKDLEGQLAAAQKELEDAQKALDAATTPEEKEAAQKAVDEAQAKCKSISGQLDSAKIVAAAAKNEAYKASIEVATRKGDVALAVQLVMASFFDGMQAVVDAMADYTEACAEQHKLAAKENYINSVMEEDTLKRLQKLLNSSEDQEEKLNEVMQMVANSIISIQQQLLGLTTATEETIKRINQERMV